MDIFLETRIRRLLLTQGWAMLQGTAVACRDFRTAVGIKRAFVYISDYGPGCAHFCLQGDYRSEGRNVLESCGVLIPKEAARSALPPFVRQFTASAHKAIKDSYAVRLLRTSSR